MSKAVVALVASVCAALAGAQSLDDVLARYVAARGGLATLRALRSARMTGAMSTAGAAESPFTWFWKRPNRLRSEFIFGGRPAIEAFDGTTGWMVMPLSGREAPEPMPAEVVARFTEEADFEGGLVDWRAKGNTVELLGDAMWRGAAVVRLKLTRRFGVATIVYLDRGTGLEVGSESTRTVRGRPIEFESTSGDYRRVDGLMIPFVRTTMAKGMPGGQTLRLTRVELDVPLDDALFAMPAAPPAATPTR